jgi:hypothetical protein
MVKRNSKSGFMAGAHVFPGGVLDSHDAVELWQEYYRAAGHHDLPEDFAFRIASIRETFEESGVLLLEDSKKNDSLIGEARLSWRTRVHDDASAFQELCILLGSLPDIFSLKAWAHWITPEAEPRRYDTRFYVAWVSKTPNAIHDEKETVASVWSSPLASLESFSKDGMFLPPPTWFTLRELSECRTWKDIQDASRDLSPIQPFFGQVGERLVLALPGDALHDAKTSTEGRNRIIILSDGKYAFESNLEGAS